MTQGAAATRALYRGQARRSNAVSALAVSALFGAVLGAAARAPVTWTQADRLLPTLRPASPLAPTWTALAGALPVAELAQRAEILAYALVVATSMAATWAGYTLFRGRARWLAGVASGGLTTLVLLHWLHGTAFASAFPALPSALFATLGVTALVRPLVHLGCVTPPAGARALAAGSMVALLDPLWGVPLVAVLGLVARLRAPRRTATGWSTAVAVGLGPAVLAVIGLHLSGASMQWPRITGVHLGLPPLDLLERHLPAAALYPGLALIVLLVVPLRWRGGPSLVMLATAALVVQVDGRPLAPLPALLVLCCVATSGWIWLAGTVWIRHPRLDVLQAAAAATIIAALALAPMRDVGRAELPIAQERPSMPLVRLHDCALEHPGDVLLVHDPWLHQLLQDRRSMEGWRPDIEMQDAMAIDDADILVATTTWHVGHRRVLSDSYDAAGRWPAQWVAETGPLFRFVGPEADAQDQTAAALDANDTERAWAGRQPVRAHRPVVERGRLVRLSIERARFRRATGDPHTALEALGLSPMRQRALETRLQLAQSVRPHAGVGSELPAALDDRAWLGIARPRAWAGKTWTEGIWTEAALAAEAGDLLYAHGEQHRAVELLAEAAAEGYAPAWGALARWQLRAGEDSAAHDTLQAMARDPELRGELLEVVQWLLARDRVLDARRILTATHDRTRHTTEELATRLMLLRALVQGRPSTFARRAPGEEETLTRR